MAGADDEDDLADRPLAIEERDDVQSGNGEQDHLLGEARRVAKTDEAFAVLLDREGLECP